VTLYHLGLAAACAALAMLGTLLELTWLPRALWIAAAVQAGWVLNSAVGWVTLRADSVVVWRLLGRAAVPERDVRRFVVKTTSFGSHVRLERHDKRTLRLPAPAAPRPLSTDRFDAQVAMIGAWAAGRFGGAAGPAPDGRRPGWAFPVVVVALLVAAALPDRPWGWVSFSDASGLPDVCAAVRERAPDAVGSGAGEPSVSGRTDVQRVGCQWVVDGTAVKVTLTRYFRSGLHSGGSVAATHVMEAGPGVAAWSSGRIKEVPGSWRLGDNVISGYLLGPGDQPAAATVIVRECNVIVDAVVGWGSDPDGSARPVEPADEARLFALVRAVLAALRAD
jgi:hypothetical protein